jgi:hypothetical protein
MRRGELVLRVGITSLFGPPGSGLNGDVLAQPQQFTDCQVEITYANDARTARVTISAYDKAAAEVRPLDRFLKIWYRYAIPPFATETRVIFWGPITVPEWNTEQATVTINAHDPSLRIKHSYINHSDIGILDEGGHGGTQPTGKVQTDATGMRQLCYSAEEHTDNFPLLGITDGYNTANPAPLMNDGNPRTMAVVRGDEAWAKMQDLGQDPLAPDFEIEPWDTHLFGTPPPKTYARLNVWRKEDSGLIPSLVSATRFDYKGNPDKRGSVVFQYGFGADNLESLTYSPGGDRVLNYYVAVTEHDDRPTPANRGTRQDYESRVRYGTFMGWKAAGRDIVKQATDPREFLLALAGQYVAAYGTPPEFMTFVPKPDTAKNSRIYIRDWWPGDTITIQARQGHLRLSADAFITKATIKQLDAAANTQAEVEAVPLAPGSLSDPGDSI